MEEESDDINSLLARSFTGELTEVERERLAMWINEHPERSREMTELHAIWERSSSLEIPDSETFENRWTKISGHTAAKVKPLMHFYRVAASLLLFTIVSVLVAFWVQSKAVVVATNNGEIRKVELPEGSTVTLNSTSSITYNPVLWFLGRKISLEGEAFFSVAKNGDSFAVSAGKVSIEVLGTSFDVKHRNDAVSVSCFTGKVSVTSGVGEKAQLEKGVKCTLQNEKLVVTSFDPARGQAIAWMERKLDFERTSLQEVFQTIGQFYDVHVIYDLKSKQTFSGTFEKESTAEDVITVVCLSTGLSYSREDSSRFKITE